MKAVKFSDQMLSEMNQLFSIWGMTALQHNALRVLYENETEEGLASKELGKQLYTRVPDVTRLLDRLADKGWLVRERDPNNRRVVRARLTAIGEELIASITAPLKELEARQLEQFSLEDKRELIRLFELKGISIN